MKENSPAAAADLPGYSFQKWTAKIPEAENSSASQRGSVKKYRKRYKCSKLWYTRDANEDQV